MNRTPRTRRAGIAALALTASLGLAACSTEAEMETTSDTPAATQSETPENSATDTETPTTDTDSPAVAAEPFGPGCADIPADGAGSFNGMATEPVATAASANPLLGTLVTAVGEAGLVDTLNSADDITVFAPTDDAFAKIPKKQLNAVLADKDALTQVLTHHVVPGKLTPDMLAGTHETLNGDQIMVDGAGENFTAEGAAVLCGNIETANATVYVIDTVMMPAM